MMDSRHLPDVTPRYWCGITLASVFGTNMGDFYAHESGLGLLGGLPFLVALFAAIFVTERFDRLRHPTYYWLCIIVMRTGATNIADYLAGRRGLGIDRGVLSLGLGLVIAGCAWRAARQSASASSLPDTTPTYWLAMLAAGIFGTVLGDLCEHLIGDGPAALALAAVFAASLVIRKQALLPSVYGYWLAIAAARTVGTAIGDWLAGSKSLGLGLPLATLLTGATFAAVLLIWRERDTAEPVPVG